MQPAVCLLVEVEDVNKFGGKAANLGVLLRAGLRVPTGFGMSIEAFDGDGKLLDEAQKNAAVLLDSSKQYAVRSSATVEDAAQASWAGQFESYLNVAAADVTKQIEACHAAVKARADAYASEQGNVGALVANVAVVVQEMVDAKFAGVTFTKNPGDGANQIIIEYVAGLGESLVHGDADPERIVWSRSRKAVKEQTESKTPFELEELIKLAEKVEKTFGGVPQDIEWAYDGNTLWLVQSRPITTLQERGVGKHYLGDPGDLFYWGPSRAVPLFMDDFLVAERKNFAELFTDPQFPTPPRTIVMFHGGQVVWLNKHKDFNKFVTAIFRAYEAADTLEKDEADFATACQRIDEYFAANTDFDPAVVNKMFTAAWKPTLRAEMSLYGAEAVLHERLARFDEKVQQDIWGIMTLPDAPTFLQQIDIKLATSEDPQKMAIEYPWIQDGYSGVLSDAQEYFKERLKIVKDNTLLQAGSAEKRQTISDEHKLSKSEVRALDLARELSVFMDNRKAWMMRSRRYIALVAEQAAQSLGRPVEQLRATTLNRLARHDPSPFAGWSFLNGANITLTGDDVALAWDWYVEFRASHTVLSGLIASSGGRHFMNGEVFIAHSPADAMPDNAVLVVPSTSPSFVPLMRRARALVTDHGGMMSHAAIVAREFGLPCIVGTKRATKVLKNGDKVVLDLVKGEVNR